MSTFSSRLTGKHTVLVLTTLVLLLMMKPVFAQTVNTSLTLEMAIEKTLQNNPELNLFVTQRKSLDGQQYTANLRPALEIGVEVENIGGSGELKGTDQAETTLALSSFIELGNKRQKRLAVIDARRSKLTMEQQIKALALLAEVTRNYIAVLAAQETLALADQAALIADDALLSVEQRVQAGATTRAEALRAQALKIQAQQQRQRADTQLAVAKSELVLMWGQTEIDFDRLSGDLYAVGGLIDVDNFESQLLQNPVVALYASELLLREAELRLAQSQSSPNVEWQVGARQMQESGDSALVFGVSVPLFSNQRSRGTVQSAQTNVLETQQRKEFAVLQLQSRLMNLVKQQQQAVDQVQELQQRIVPLLEEAATEARTAYERGRYRYLDWIAAQQELISGQQELITTATRALQLRAEIEQLTASPFVDLTSLTE